VRATIIAVSTVVLLGPQRLRPTLARAVEDVGVSGMIGAVTAGWQERESEVDELREHLGGRVVNLGLYARADEVFDADRELFAAYRARQERLQRFQELYRLRLGFAMEPARRLLRRRGGGEVVRAEVEEAIEALRRLDAAHLERARSVYRAFEERWRPLERDSVRRHRDELREVLEGCEAFAIAGGHVAVLLNRLRLFGISELVVGKPLFAWSGGAMVAGERLVLFHDHPPQGPGDAEVLGEGLGLYTGVLPLPDARHRLSLDDGARVSLLARRFPDDVCVAIDDGAIYFRRDGEWSAAGTLRRLAPDGSVEGLVA